MQKDLENTETDSIKRKVLHKTRISTGTHHYFLELKEAENGSRYVVIDQKRKDGESQYSSTKMRIFEDEILEFHRQFKKIVKLMVDDDFL